MTVRTNRRTVTSTRPFSLSRIEVQPAGTHRAAHSAIADWLALNSNDLTWIALVTIGVLAVGMSM